jgi:tripartite-type tricarboxylate transporter receptor subunit TctC
MQAAVTLPSAPVPACPLTLAVPGKENSVGGNIAKILRPLLAKELDQSVELKFADTISIQNLITGIASASADGCSILMGSWSTQVADPVTRTLSYDPVSDFTPVALGPINNALLIGSKDNPAANLQEFLASIPSSVGRLTIGVESGDSLSRLGALHFQSFLATQLEFVQIANLDQALQFLNEGKISLLIGDASYWQQRVRHQEVKALAVISGRRLAGLPETVTTEEISLPGFYISQWRGFWLPKNAPESITARLNMAIAKVLNDTTVTNQLTRLGLEIVPLEMETPEALSKFHQSELSKWKQISIDGGLRR